MARLEMLSMVAKAAVGNVNSAHPDQDQLLKVAMPEVKKVVEITTIAFSH